MGYPMTYDRVINRNLLGGNYTSVRYTGTATPILGIEPGEDSRIRMISGDLRRLEQDSVSGYRLDELAKLAGVEPHVVQRVLGVFFQGAPQLPPHDTDK